MKIECWKTRKKRTHIICYFIYTIVNILLDNDITCRADHNGDGKITRDEVQEVRLSCVNC